MHGTTTRASRARSRSRKTWAPTDRSVRTYLKELETAELLEIKQRGLGKTNLYRLHLTVKPKKSTKAAGPDRQIFSGLDRKRLPFLTGKSSALSI